MTRFALLVILTLASAACASAPRPQDLRLDRRITPLGYAITLSIDPAVEPFEGIAEIRLSIPTAAREVWMHGVDLDVHEATIGGQSARAIPGTDGRLGFRWAQPISGEQTLTVRYRGRAYEKELDGVFRRQVDGRWYVFTQFEDVLARRAFPCFDEPGHKVPLRLTLRVPIGQRAFGNAPIARVVPAKDDWQSVELAETPPLPTYLWAFAVGPFTTVGPATQQIIALHGEAEGAAFSAKETGAILALLEQFFGSPYPYAKLDQIAVPGFSGAMENAGLITYDHDILVSAPGEQTPVFLKRWGAIVAHEIAHHWFGNLVTPRWWDDLWLNESFATWIEPEIVAGWRSDLGAEMIRIEARATAMDLDALATTRKIREPIVTADDIAGAFDSITYEKGSVVLDMIDGWIGRDAMRRGLAAYFEKHRHGVATTADFVAAIAEASELDVASVLGTFLDQPGTPLVTAALRCDGAPRITLRQARSLPLGSPARRDTRWRIPVCARTEAGRVCTILAEETGSLALDRCPARWTANDGGRGYYRVHYEGRVMPDVPTPAELLGFVDDQRALVDAGVVPLGDVLALAEPLARTAPTDALRRRHLLTAALTAGILDEELVPTALRPNRDRFYGKLFAAEAARLGWTPRPGESADDRLLRPSMLGVAVGPSLAEGIAFASRWLHDPTIGDPDLVELALTFFARKADAAGFARLLAVAREGSSATDRGRAFDALGRLGDPALLEKALRLSLDPSLDPLESARVVKVAFETKATRPAAWRFLREHLPALEKRLPRNHGTAFIVVAANLCTAEERGQAEAFFRPRVASWLGAPRALAQTLERIDLCIARKKVLAPAADAFLRNQ